MVYFIVTVYSGKEKAEYKEYRSIAGKREASVDSRGIVVEV